MKKISILFLTFLALVGLGPIAGDAVYGKNKGKKTEAARSATGEEQDWDVESPPGEPLAVTIDTDETTWSDVDVSPDGKTVIFDMLGDLYTVPIAGGNATALTHSVAWDFQPRYSPDGSQIAFISDRGGANNLWVMDADGGHPRAVTEEEEHLVHNPWWSPDGQYIAGKKDFTTTRSIPAGEIWLFHRGGGGGLLVVERSHGEESQKNIAEPAFSPDGRFLYYSQDTTPGVRWQYNKDSTGQIFVIQRLDLETGETEVYAGGAGGAVRPTPSPDGKLLAFIKRTPGSTSAIYLKDLASGKEWAIYDHLDRDLQETGGSQGNATALAWTPDSASLVFWAGGKIRRIEAGSVPQGGPREDSSRREASIIPIHVHAEKTVRRALRFPVAVAPDELDVKMVRWAQQSPAGDRIVFQALGHLYVREGDGEPRRLTDQDGFFENYPSFSRDGRQIVYTTWDDQDLGSLRVLSLADGTARTLTAEPGHYLEPSFSPDGEHVVYRKATGGFLLSGEGSMEPGIYLLPAGEGGGEPRRLVQSGFDAHFGAGGDRVYYSETVDETEIELRSVDLEGDDERTHLHGKEVTEIRVSPDGRWVAFTEGFNAYVAPFVATGRTVDIGSEVKSIPVRQVSSRSGELIHWSADSSRLHWSLGATLFTRELKDAFDFLAGAPVELPEPVAEGIDLGFRLPADRPAGHLALVGGRVVTLRDSDHVQEVLDEAVVLIEGNRIVAVGPSGEVDIPADAYRLDVSGKTVIPGLIDVHAHGSMGSREIVPEQNWMQLSNVAFGVTTIHDPSNDTSEIFAAAELQRIGAIVAPRIFSTGTILYGAHDPHYTAKVSSYEDAEFHVRRLKDVGAISVKSYMQPRRDQRQQILAAGRKLGIMVVPEGGAMFQNNLTMIVDGHTGIEHALPLATCYDDVVQLWSQTEVGYTPTLGVAYGGLSGETYWYDRTDVWRDERLMRYTPRFLVEPQAMRRLKAPDEHYNHFHVAAFAKRLRGAGVGVQVGAHGQREGLASHWEMWMLEQGGFSPWEAIRAATIDGARYLGMDADIGSIETGKLADLVVLDGNPLEDLRRSEYVVYTVLNGRIYEAATMNEIGPTPRERQPLFFEKEGGDTIHPATRQYLDSKARRFGWVH